MSSLADLAAWAEGLGCSVELDLEHRPDRQPHLAWWGSVTWHPAGGPPCSRHTSGPDVQAVVDRLAAAVSQAIA